MFFNFEFLFYNNIVHILLKMFNLHLDRSNYKVCFADSFEHLTWGGVLKWKILQGGAASMCGHIYKSFEFDIGERNVIPV